MANRDERLTRGSFLLTLFGASHTWRRSLFAFAGYIIVRKLEASTLAETRTPPALDTMEIQ